MLSWRLPSGSFRLVELAKSIAKNSLVGKIDQFYGGSAAHNMCWRNTYLGRGVLHHQAGRHRHRTPPQPQNHLSRMATDYGRARTRLGELFPFHGADHSRRYVLIGVRRWTCLLPVQRSGPPSSAPQDCPVRDNSALGRRQMSVIGDHFALACF